MSLLAGCLLLFLKITENREKLPRKILRQRKNRNFSILNSSSPSQNNRELKNHDEVHDDDVY